MRLINADDLIERINAVIENGLADPDGLHPVSAEVVLETINVIPTATPEPHWIPVTKDTLPEKNRVVVVCGDKGTWDFGTYRGHGDDIHFWHWKKNTYKRVYWWMYKEDALPEPFKGVTP